MNTKAKFLPCEIVLPKEATTWCGESYKTVEEFKSEILDEIKNDV